MAQEEATRQIEPVRRWKFKQDGGNSGLSISKWSGQTHRMIKGPGRFAVKVLAGAGDTGKTEECQQNTASDVDDEHLKDGAKAGSSSADVRVRECMRAAVVAGLHLAGW